MRLMLTPTGHHIHIVREQAYHGVRGHFYFSLCGHPPKRDSLFLFPGDGFDEAARSLFRSSAVCQTCVKHFKNGSR